MVHSTVLVIHDDEEDLDDLMNPYHAMDMTQLEMANDPRAVFQAEIAVSDMEDEYYDWKDERLLKISDMEQKITDRDFDDIKKKASRSLDESAIMKHLSDEIKRNKEWISKFDTPNRWIKGWGGFVLNNDGTYYGRYHNPNMRWDWCQIGGDWSGSLDMKAGKECFMNTKKWMGSDPLPPGTCNSAIKSDVKTESLKNIKTYAVLSDKWYEPNNSIEDTDLLKRVDKIPEIIAKNDIPDYIKDGKCGSKRKKWMEELCNMLDKYYEESGSTHRLKEKYSGNRNLGDDIRNESYFTELEFVNTEYDRFIKDLHPNTILTILDCHL